jgi:hypothetical protein
MVTVTALKIPVIGQFVEHIREVNSPEIVKDSLRVVVAAVAIVAFGVFPALSARIATIPYIGNALVGFQSLSPLTQKVIVGLTSLPALALASGVAYIASGVAILAQAHMALSVVSSLDALSKLFVGALLIHQYRRVEVGAVELLGDEIRRTSVGSTTVTVPEVGVERRNVEVPVPVLTGESTEVQVPTLHHDSSVNTPEGRRAAKAAH